VSVSEVGDRGLTWDQLRKVAIVRQAVAKRMSGEMDRANTAGDVIVRESLRRRLQAMLA